VSNKRRLRRQVPAEVAALARSARCSDCPARGQARWRDGEWNVVVHHAPACPALHGLTPGLHGDAERTVAQVAAQLGRVLGYERDGDQSGLVTSGGAVTASGSGRPW